MRVLLLKLDVKRRLQCGISQALEIQTSPHALNPKAIRDTLEAPVP